MRKRKLIWMHLPALAAITLAAILGVTWYSTALLREFHLAETAAQMEQQAGLLAGSFRPLFLSGFNEQIDEMCKGFGEESSIRITAILPNGTAVGDTDENVSGLSNYRNWPEVSAALRGLTGSSVRHIDSVGETMMLVALPVKSAKETVGVLLVSTPITALNQEVARVQLASVAAALTVSLLAALLSFHIISRRVFRPLEDVQHGTKQLASGNLDYRIQVTGPEEIAAVASALNLMAQQLSALVAEISVQRNQLDGVLSGMSEGVIAVDKEEMVMLINRSAERFLQTEAASALGEKLYKLTRIPELLSMSARALVGRETEEAEITLYESEGKSLRTIRATGEVLRGEDGRPAGAILVMREVTQELKLERIRRDFIANVSHELRTPITAIKGFAESLLDGVLEDRETAAGFLRTIIRQADRLNSIIEDLLALSRIEQSGEQQTIAKTRLFVKPMLESAADGLSVNAEEAGAEVSVECEDELEAEFNSTLLQQAVSNLIDNAINYAGGKVVVSAYMDGGELCISIRDNGPGIEEAHLERVFERFYRIDKKASRKTGGTGLGLAIVKHIALTHGGRVEARSKPGSGSEFIICIPGQLAGQPQPPSPFIQL